jgi:hypothetical protein
MASAVAFGAESAISVERGRSLVPIAVSAAPRAAKAASSGSWEMNRTTSEPRLWLDCVRGKTTVTLSIRILKTTWGAKASRTGGTVGHVFQTASFDLDTPDTRI